jgi:hypothetical protein
MKILYDIREMKEMEVVGIKLYYDKKNDIMMKKLDN